MASMIKKAAVWLGLSDDRYEGADEGDYDEYSQPVHPDEAATEAIHRDPAVPALPAGQTTAAARSGTQVVDLRPPPTARKADISRITTVHPRNYNEARTIGEHFREGIPVIMNLSDMEDADAKRLVDFSAGLTFGLRGTIERVTSKVFLLSPHNVEVTAEDKERIAGGFYNQS